jgi:hypothetical protein
MEESRKLHIIVTEDHGNICPGHLRTSLHFKIDLQEHQIYRSPVGCGSYAAAAGSVSGYASS